MYNTALGEDYKLEDELAQAIQLVYDARNNGYKVGERVCGYARQMNLFPFDNGETVADYTNATIMMLADALNDGRSTWLKTVLQTYNKRAKDASIGQMDLFTGEVETKDEIIKKIFKELYNGQQTTNNGKENGRNKGKEQNAIAPSGNTGSEEDEHEQFALTRRDEAVSLVNKMEDDAEIAPEIELTISNWDTLFGEEGIVKTPLGEVKMGENQFAKLMRQGRESKLGMIKPTLENPDVIIEASSEAKEGSITERASSYIFVKAFRKSDGSRYYYFTSVTVSKEGKEVVVSSQEKSRNRLLRLLTDEEIIWRTPKDATTSSAERQGLEYVQPLDAETATKGSGLTPQRISSADKVTESSEEWQEQEEKFSPTPSGNTGGEEGTYTLSSKTSENGESFYQNNDGNIDLADIPDEVFDKIGKPKAPFRPTPSMLKHVFDRHGKEMGLHHADDAIDFVLDVMDNFDHVRQGDKGAIIFSIENGRSRTGRRAVTILLDSQRGEYYGIKTSGYERIEGLHKRPLLWEKGAKKLLLQVLLLQMLPPMKPNKATSLLAAHQTMAMILWAKLRKALKSCKERRRISHLLLWKMGRTMWTMLLA